MVTNVPRVLLVEDSAETRKLITQMLIESGYHVTSVGRGAEATACLEREAFAVIILDLGLPDGSGIERCQQWRRAGLRIPILMLTARSDIGSRVSGLDAGADDYLAKPFAFAELKARLRALLRGRGGATGERVFVRAGLEVDFGRRMAVKDGAQVPITKRELDVFERLVRAGGHAVARDDLLDEIWGEVTPEAGASLEVIVGRLRRKLDAPGSEGLIRTLRGHGYALAKQEGAAP